MTTLYIVGSVGFEYNDEIYYANDTSSVTPTQAFRIRSNAEMAALQLTIEQLKTDNLGYYGYDTNEVFNDVEVAAKLIEPYNANIAKQLRDNENNETYLYDFGDDLAKVLGQMQPEDVQLFIHNLAIKFYTVHELEVEDE